MQYLKLMKMKINKIQENGSKKHRISQQERQNLEMGMLEFLYIIIYNIKSFIYFSKNETLTKQGSTKQTIIQKNNQKEYLSKIFSYCHIMFRFNKRSSRSILSKTCQQRIVCIIKKSLENYILFDFENYCIRQIDLLRKIKKSELDLWIKETQLLKLVVLKQQTDLANRIKWELMFQIIIQLIIL
ncbi:unnamed protein product [Paramecium sonneborni]|uniref:Uncharacterized protein n=1 Tax=Paramecium sonneborni TaxID=65129 RepID=A0A8S1M1V3_9CILI|nr:unnamed protein product [Paramecium sonneborni]